MALSVVLNEARLDAREELQREVERARMLNEDFINVVTDERLTAEITRLQDVNTWLSNHNEQLAAGFDGLRHDHRRAIREKNRIIDELADFWTNEWMKIRKRSAKKIVKLKKQLNVRKLSRGRQVLANVQQMRRKRR